MKTRTVKIYGHNRKQTLVKCSFCRKQVWKLTRQLIYKHAYCNIVCKNKHQDKRVTTTCAWCNKPILKSSLDINYSKSGNVYCSQSCATALGNRLYKSGKDNPNFKQGEHQAYRQWALFNYGKKCQNTMCPIKFKYPEAMLDVHHKDGRKNHNLSNLEVLCVWCHATKTRIR
jgi:hypothetical protein